MAIDEMFPNDRSLATEALGGTAVPAAAPQGNGMLGGIMPMLVQYLSAAGQDIGAGKPLGTNVHAATKQNLAAQSQTKLLKKVLAGGGKVVMDGNKFQISGGSHLLEGDDGAAGTGASTKSSSAPGETTNTPDTGASIMSKILGGNVSQDPTSSPLGDINANDLVGLTPENISAALAIKFGQDRLTQESVNSQFDNAYKLAQINKMNQPTEEKSTAGIQEYQYAVRSGYKGTFEDWKSEKDTTNQSDYKAARDSGYAGTFMEYLQESAKLKQPNININTNEKKLEYQRDEARQAGMVAMDEGKEVSKAMNKAIESNTFQNKNFGLMNSKDPIKMQQYKDNVRQAKLATVQEYIDNGKGVGDWAFDHKTGRATVRVTWPNNETRTYTYELDK